jgi:uncharacterized membrane protein YfcA
MIDPWAYPALTAVALLTGFIDAIAGGGGLIMMPALLFAGLSPIHALAANKLQSVFGTCVAMANFGRKGLIDWKASRWAVLLVFIGATAGVVLVQAIDASVLALIVPVLLLFAAGYIILSPRMSDEDAQQRLGEKGYAPVAGAVGFYDGFFGPGAGTLYTTSLVALRGLGLTRASAHTKLLNFTSNVAGVLMFAIGGKMIWLLGLCMALGAMLGGWIGSHTAMRFGARLIRPLLVMISLGMTAKLPWDYFAR